MKFECHVDIDAPRDKVIELFDNFDNLKEWQDGFIRHEHIEGVSGQPGAKTRMFYEMRGKEMELIEIVEVRDLPHEFSGTYVHKSMTNTLKNYFEELDGGTRTRYRSICHYTELNGFIVKTMAFLFPGIFKKQVQKWMDQFKAFVERSV